MSPLAGDLLQWSLQREQEALQLPTLIRCAVVITFALDALRVRNCSCCLQAYTCSAVLISEWTAKSIKKPKMLNIQRSLDDIPVRFLVLVIKRVGEINDSRNASTPQILLFD